MKYDLQSEINDLPMSKVGKKKLITILKDIVKGPGQIKSGFEEDRIVIEVNTPEYEGYIIMIKNNQNRMFGGLKHKTLPQTITLHEEEYGTRYISGHEGCKGIYEVRFMPGEEKGQMKSVATFYDADVVDYCYSTKLAESILSRDISVKELLRPKGLIPDYEGESPAKGDEISVKPEDIMETVNYFRNNIPAIVEEPGGPLL